jgi:hypothetical protein
MFIVSTKIDAKKRAMFILSLVTLFEKVVVKFLTFHHVGE